MYARAVRASLRPPKPVNAQFTVVDLYESKMSEYDSSFAFMPLAELQNLRVKSFGDDNYQLARRGLDGNGQSRSQSNHCGDST